jgi:pantetheine-phosphate adenylyltransferase
MPGIAVFPGSFDPITRGHESIVQRSLPLFDTVIIGIGTNSTKSSMFPLEKRKQLLEQTFAGNPKIKIVDYATLTVDFCRQHGAHYIIRGLRSVTDFEYESNIARMNRMMAPEVETVFMISLPEFSAIHSTIVREIIKHGGDVSQFIPQGIAIK